MCCRVCSVGSCQSGDQVAKQLVENEKKINVHALHIIVQFDYYLSLPTAKIPPHRHYMSALAVGHPMTDRNRLSPRDSSPAGEPTSLQSSPTSQSPTITSAMQVARMRVNQDRAVHVASQPVTTVSRTKTNDKKVSKYSTKHI